MSATGELVALHLVIGLAAIFYLFVGGLAFALLGKNADPFQEIGAVLWPATLVLWLLYQVATAGPRLVAWSRRPKLPKARIVERRD